MVLLKLLERWISIRMEENTCQDVNTIHFHKKNMITLPGKVYQFLMQNLWGRAQNCHHMTAYGFYYVDSIRHAQEVDYFQATLCTSYDKYLLGECDQNDKLPMGEALTLEM